MLQHVVAAVDADLRAGDVRGAEEGETHDVVPVHVGHEDVHRGGLARLAGEHVHAERPRAAAHVADVVLVAGQLDLHAGRVAAEGVREREVELLGRVGVRFLVARESLARGLHQRLRELVADIGGREVARIRPAGAPEAHAHGPYPLSNAAAASADSAPTASRTVGNTWNTRLKCEISKISATIGCSAATKMRPCCAFACRDASMKQRNPALDTYSSAERSSTIAPPWPTASSTCFMRSRVKSTHVSWSRRPSTRRTTALAKRRQVTFIVRVESGGKAALLCHRRCSRKNPSFSCAARSENGNTTQASAACSRYCIQPGTTAPSLGYISKRCPATSRAPRPSTEAKIMLS